MCLESLQYGETLLSDPIKPQRSKALGDLSNIKSKISPTQANRLSQMPLPSQLPSTQPPTDQEHPVPSQKLKQ